MITLKSVIGRLVLCIGLTFGASSAKAGVPVIDVAALLQAVQEVMNSITQIQNQVNQIQQYQQQLDSIRGIRNLGDVWNNPALQNYIPRDALQVARGIETMGYGGLNGTAKTLRDAAMLYNCADLFDEERRRCQAELAMPYQHKAFFQDALNAAKDRVGQIQSLMNEINLTQDPKAIAEVQARIEAENALLAHEQSQISLARGMVEAEVRVAEARDREAALQQISRRGRLIDHVTP